MELTNPGRSLPSRRRHTLALALLLASGFFLRVWRLDSSPLRGDEGFTMVVWLEDIRETFGSLATIDPQPPFAILSIYGWVQLAGETEFAARYLSALAGTLTIAILYTLGRRLGRPQAGLLAALLWAGSPYQVWFAQDLRSGALWVALSALSTLLLLRASSAPRRLSLWAGYVIATTLSLYTFYLELFILAAQGVYLLFLALRQPPRGLVRAWLMAWASLGLLLAPWFLQPRLYAGGYAPTAGPINLPWLFQSFVFGETLPAPFQAAPQQMEQVGLAAGLAAVLILSALALIWLRQPRRTAVFLTAYALLPVLLLSAVEGITGKGYFRPRYVLSCTPGWTLILAIGLATLAGWRRWTRTAAGIVTASILALNGLGIWHYQFDPAFAKAPDWRALAALLDRQVRPGDVIIRNYPDPTLFYYYHGEAAVTLLPTPSEDPGPALADLAQQYDTLWFLPQPSTWDPDQAAASWLAANMQLAADQMAGPFRVQAYTPYAAEQSLVEQAVDVTFGDFVRLTGVRVTPRSIEQIAPGDTFIVELFWQPLKQTEKDLTIFVHLLGPFRADGSPLWAGGDHLPQKGYASTSFWSPDGHLLRDPVQLALPPDAAPGLYVLTVGWYDPATGERIEAISPAGETGEPGGVIVLQFALGEEGR